MREKKEDGQQPLSRTEEFEALATSETGHYILRLYVSGATPRSMRAIDNIKRICETTLKDHYTLEVIDVYQQPEMVTQDQVVAAPTLIRQLPMPVRKLVGDLEDSEHVLKGLDLVKA
jgi:circadian clock protein KaiB